MKIKLTNTQKEKLTKAFMHEQSIAGQYNTVKKNYENAQKARNDLFEVIVDAHSIDMKLYDHAKTRFENGELIFTPLKSETKSAQIKKALKKKSTPKNK